MYGARQCAPGDTSLQCGDRRGAGVERRRQSADEGVARAGGVDDVHLWRAHAQRNAGSDPERTGRAQCDDDRQARRRGDGARSEIAGHDAPSESIGECDGFGFVDHQDVERAQQFECKRTRRRGVQEDARAATACPSNQRCVGSVLDFLLQHQKVRRCQLGIRDDARIRQRVCTGNDDDAVLAVVVDENGGATCAHVDPCDTVDVDSVGNEKCGRRRSERIIADGAVESYIRAGTSRRERLVGTLAAGKHCKRASGDGFARRGKVRHAAHQIQVDRAEHGDHQLFGYRFTTPFTRRILP